MTPLSFRQWKKINLIQVVIATDQDTRLLLHADNQFTL